MVMWLKRIVSYITVFIAIGYLVYTTIKAPVDLYQYMILLLLILISTTFILDNMDEDQKWRNIENDLKNIVSEISPTQIRFFDNSSDWVDAMELLVKNGKHTVDTASLDSSTRTKSPNSRSRIWNHITDCCKNENIKFRHIVRVRKNNYSNLLDRLLAGSEKENSFYAYYELPQTFSFPTFGIIDDRFISTRSPYSEGETPRYYIIENKEIAYYYIRYFKELWEQAINITDIEQIRMLYQKFESSFDEEEKKQLQEKIDQIRTKGIMSDVKEFD